MRIRKSTLKKILVEEVRLLEQRHIAVHQTLVLESEELGDVFIPPQALAAAQQAIGRSSPDAFALFKNMDGLNSSKEKSAVRGIIKKRQDAGTLPQLYDEYQTLMNQMKEESKGFWNKFKKQGNAFLVGSALYAITAMTHKDNLMKGMMATRAFKQGEAIQNKVAQITNKAADADTASAIADVADKINREAEKLKDLPQTDAEVAEIAADPNHPANAVAKEMLNTGGDDIPDVVQDLADSETKRLTAAHYREMENLNEVEPVSTTIMAAGAGWAAIERWWGVLSIPGQFLFTKMGMPQDAAMMMGGAGAAGTLAALGKAAWESITPSKFNDDLVEWLEDDDHKDEAEAVKSALKAKA